MQLSCRWFGTAANGYYRATLFPIRTREGKRGRVQNQPFRRGFVIVGACVVRNREVLGWLLPMDFPRQPLQAHRVHLSRSCTGVSST